MPQADGDYRERAALIHIPAEDLPEPPRDLFYLITLRETQYDPPKTDVAVAALVHGNSGAKKFYLEDMIEKDENSVIKFEHAPGGTSFRNGAACYACHVTGPIVPHSD